MTVFDISNEGNRYWWLIFPALAVLAADVAAWFIVRRERRLRIVRSRQENLLPMAILTFLTLVTSVLYLGPLLEHDEGRVVLARGAEYVEGRIKNFVPRPAGGHGSESFEVNGVSFRYSDYAMTPGFHSSSARGGPLRGESYVKIWYHKGVILKLQICPGNSGLAEKRLQENAD